MTRQNVACCWSTSLNINSTQTMSFNSEDEGESIIKQVSYIFRVRFAISFFLCKIHSKTLSRPVTYHSFFVESLDFLYKGLEYYSKPSIYYGNYVHNMAHFWHILPFFLQLHLFARTMPIKNEELVILMMKVVHNIIKKNDKQPTCKISG